MSHHTSPGAIPIDEAELRELLLAYRRENWRGVQTPEMQVRIVESLLRCDTSLPLRQVKPYVQLSEGSRILDLGSGVGNFVVACRQRGLRAFGIEPDRIGNGSRVTAIQIARRRLAEPVFTNGVGEKLPFRDACFDFVALDQVMEHVADQMLVLNEAARVVREGGAIYVASPNYWRFYEPHYKISWLPLMPKVLGRIYLRLRGRSSSMLNQLTYTTNGRLQKLFSKLGPDYVAVDLHREQFLRKREEGSFASRIARLMARMTRLPIVGSFLLWMVLRYSAFREGACEMVILRRRKVGNG
jgi:SAM-dependent methyltransferase